MIPPFDVGQRVKIIPVDRISGRVLRLEKDRDGWMVVVRYFHDGKSETATFYPDEVEAE